MNNKTWYAVMTGPDDSDWGTGSFDEDEALEMALKNADVYPDGYIAVILDGPDPVCVAEIHSIAPKYHIQREYLDSWGVDNPDDIVDAAEVVRLAHEWEKPISELLGQLIIG